MLYSQNWVDHFDVDINDSVTTWSCSPVREWTTDPGYVPIDETYLLNEKASIVVNVSYNILTVIAKEVGHEDEAYLFFKNHREKGKWGKTMNALSYSSYQYIPVSGSLKYAKRTDMIVFVEELKTLFFDQGYTNNDGTFVPLNRKACQLQRLE